MALGETSQVLVASELTGMSKYVAYIRSKPHDDYYLHGAARMTKDVKRVVILAGLSSGIMDELLAMLLEDDRLLMQLESVHQTIEEELQILSRLRDTVWDLYASMIDESGITLRSDVFYCVYSQLCFFRWRVLEPLRKYPWKLAVGCCEDNLTTLEGLDHPPEEHTAKQFWLAMRHGVAPRSVLVATLQKVKALPKSSRGSEQAHASAAMARKYHPEIGQEVMRLKAFAHAASQLARPAEDIWLPCRTYDIRNLQRFLETYKQPNASKHNLANLFV